MVNIVSIKKYQAFNYEAARINMRHLQERVAAMKLADHERQETNSVSLTKENANTNGRN